MKITHDRLDDLINSLHDLSAPELEFEIRKSYSGRGMYGRECIGFVTDTPLELHGAVCAILAEQYTLWECDELDSKDFAGIFWYDLNAQMDSMGLSSIVYYSNLSLDMGNRD